MANILEIIKFPDTFLKGKSKEVAEVTEELKTLIEDMRVTMYEDKGIGLAAPQVGHHKRLIVMDVPDDEVEGEEYTYKKGDNFHAFINPVIIEKSGEIKFDEGCLSFPGFTAEVTRASEVTLKAMNKEGKEVEIKAEGLFAICIQHEIDHLDGMLFIDRLSRLKKASLIRKYKKDLKEGTLEDKRDYI